MSSEIGVHLDQQRREAARVLTLLAQGRNPHTFEVLDSQDVCNDASVVRALFAAAEALRILSRKKKGLEKKHSDRPGRPLQPGAERQGKVWDEEEDRELNRAFDERLGLSSIAVRHGRTSGAILARLVRLDRISDQDEGRRLLQWRTSAAKAALTAECLRHG